MEHSFRRLCAVHNTAGLIAGAWGFLLGAALFNVFAVWIAFVCGAAPWLIYTIAGIVSGSIAVGGCFLLTAEYVNPSVRTARDFVRIVGLATRYALQMPIVVPSILLLILTLRYIAWTFVFFYLLPKIRRDMARSGLVFHAA